MPISAEELLSIVQQHWRSDHEFDDKLERSPELKRFHAVWKQALKRHEQWCELMDELRAALPYLNIGDATATCDSSFKCIVYTNREPVSSDPQEGGARSRRWTVVGCLSVLAPVYTVYGVQYDYKGREVRGAARVFFEPLPAQMQALAQVVARKIESRYGAEALPRKIAETQVPLIVHRKEPPETTLFHALFTPEPENLPL
ncbi:hypothetical protein [Archangium violaceum]|uniref:Uncharacterized protein n=1 Tax=Archangium violaceum Cb vi76 TaxID=1406225 RepID=A0A084SMB5_9BACT|nr:hypothetical protein [Archangium violaceum]KFA89600.1 hypothetical protein Q664_33590 [Archangium violaceum Cb vi76]